MKKPITIVLADQSYAIKPLRLGTIREIDLARTNDLPEDQKAREAFFFDMYVGVIATALKEDHPDMTPEAIFLLRTDLAEVIAAYTAVMHLSGLITENPPKGEQNASTGN